jgi:DNA-binding transcriptional MocR family regulator
MAVGTNAATPGYWTTGHWFAMRGAGRGAPPVNATALIRGMFHKISNKPQPGMGVFPPDWLESTFMPAAVRKVTGTRALQDFSLQYGEPLGDSGLRRLLAKKLATLSVHTVPEQIITTVGATHALDIVSRTLLRAGDPVMVEEPGWAVEFARLDGAGHAHPAGAAPRRWA